MVHMPTTQLSVSEEKEPIGTCESGYGYPAPKVTFYKGIEKFCCAMMLELNQYKCILNQLKIKPDFKIGFKVGLSGHKKAH